MLNKGSSPVQMNVPTDIFNQSNEQNTRNIKVCARFRPCNKTEEVNYFGNFVVKKNLGND